ncbi:hypothetical protein, partial [Streptosporangium sp. NPDC002607]
MFAIKVRRDFLVIHKRLASRFRHGPKRRRRWGAGLKVPGRASVCLLAACLCELVVVGVSLALLPGLAAEL